MKPIMTLLVITMVMVAAAGCRPGPEVGGALQLAVIGNPNLFNPLLSSDPSSREIEARIFEGLVGFNEKLERVGVLATHWEFSQDGRAWTFYLKEGVLWHDGYPFTAADVKFTFETAAFARDYPGPQQDRFSVLEGVEVLDDYRVRFLLKTPFAPFIHNLGLPIVPKHIFDPLAANLDSYPSVGEMFSHPANWLPVGTGPWRYGGWYGEQIILERNQHYHGQPAPYIETLIYNIHPNLDSAVTALTQGRLDYLAGIPDQTLAELEEGLAQDYNFFAHPDLSYDYLGFNFREDAFGGGENPLRDLLVRQAIAAAINRQDLVDQVLGGRGQVVHSPVPRSSWAQAEDDLLNLHSYNPARAQALLEQAGWTLDQEGYRTKNGQRLELTITLSGDSPRQEKLAQMLKDNLQAVGLDICLNKVGWKDFLHLYVYPGNYQLVLFGWSLGADPDAYSMFHSSQAAGGLNFGGYANENVDTLLVLGRSTLESQIRREVYFQLQAELSRDLPYVFLCSRNLTTVVRKDVYGIVSSPLGLIAQEFWYIKPK